MKIVKEIIIKDSRFNLEKPKYWSEVNGFRLNDNKIIIDMIILNNLKEEIKEEDVLKSLNSLDLIYDSSELNYYLINKVYFTKNIIYHGNLNGIYSLDKKSIYSLLKNSYKICFVDKMDYKSKHNLMNNLNQIENIIPFNNFFLIKTDENISFRYGNMSFISVDMDEKI